MVVAVNTIKITVEQQRQILAVHPYKVHMVQMGQGEQLTFFQYDRLVVDIQFQLTGQNPYKLIQGFILQQSLVFM